MNQKNEVVNVSNVEKQISYYLQFLVFSGFKFKMSKDVKGLKGCSMSIVEEASIPKIIMFQCTYGTVC